MQVQATTMGQKKKKAKLVELRSASRSSPLQHLHPPHVQASPSRTTMMQCGPWLRQDLSITVMSRPSWAPSPSLWSYRGYKSLAFFAASCHTNESLTVVKGG